MNHLPDPTATPKVEDVQPELSTAEIDTASQTSASQTSASQTSRPEQARMYVIVETAKISEQLAQFSLRGAALTAGLLVVTLIAEFLATAGGPAAVSLRGKANMFGLSLIACIVVSSLMIGIYRARAATLQRFFRSQGQGRGVQAGRIEPGEVRLSENQAVPDEATVPDEAAVPDEATVPDEPRELGELRHTLFNATIAQAMLLPLLPLLILSARAFGLNTFALSGPEGMAATGMAATGMAAAHASQAQTWLTLLFAAFRQ